MFASGVYRIPRLCFLKYDIPWKYISLIYYWSNSSVYFSCWIGKSHVMLDRILPFGPFFLLWIWWGFLLNGWIINYLVHVHSNKIKSHATTIRGKCIQILGRKIPRNFPIEKAIFIKLTLFKSGRNTTKTATSLTNLVLLFQKYKNMFTWNWILKV